MDKGMIETRTPAGVHPLLRPAVLDRIEQVAIVVLWVLLVDRVWHSSNPFAMLMLLSETAVVIFVLIRRSTQAISVHLGDWLLAITATAAPLMIIPSADTLPGV